MKKLPSGEGVLYDRVTQQYFENAGTGTLGTGPLTESVQAGELHFDVPAGKTATHSAVTIAGSVRLVKDGAGTLTLSMQNQSYGGGTDVAAGTLALGAHGGTRVYGAAGNTVWVRKGATFDIKNYHYHTDYTFVHAETTTLEVPNIGTKCLSTDVRFAGYVASYLGGNTDTNTGLITVTERFTPSADTATWYDTVLADGVTMDLSHLTRAFNTTCTYYKSGGSRTVSFADGAMILVDFGGRRVKSGAQVISWSSDAAPDETVTFKMAPGQQGLLRRTATGVVYVRGFAVFVR